MNVPRRKATLHVGYPGERQLREPTEPGQGKKFSQVSRKVANGAEERRGRELHGGFAPKPPGFIAFLPGWWEQRERGSLAPSIPAPRSALRSHPCVALSSASATGKFSLTSRKETQ
jgi:hypothetical protein